MGLQQEPVRPPFCIIEQCKPVMVYGYTAKEHAEGNSGFCMGENSNIEKWQAEKVEHVNDLCFCIYTPFKGWTRYVMNNDDFEIISCLLWRFARKTGRKFKVFGPNGGGYVECST